MILYIHVWAGQSLSPSHNILEDKQMKKLLTAVETIFVVFSGAALAQQPTPQPVQPISASTPTSCPRPYLDPSQVKTYVNVQGVATAIGLAAAQVDQYNKLVYNTNYDITAAVNTVTVCDDLIEQIKDNDSLTAAQVGSAVGVLVTDEEQVARNAITEAVNLQPNLFRYVLTPDQQTTILAAQAKAADAQNTLNIYYGAFTAGFLAAPYTIDSFEAGYPYPFIPAPQAGATTSPMSPMARMFKAAVAEATADHARVKVGSGRTANSGQQQ